MYKNFQEAYYSIVKDIYENGRDVTVRGLEMREKIPVYFEIENPRDRLLNINCRQNIKRYIFGELLWYLSGRNDVKFIKKYSKMWERLSDDGIHNNSAYGNFIFNELCIMGDGLSNDLLLNDVIDGKILSTKIQWDFVKETLKKDPYSRQAVIHIKPIQMYDTKDTVCTYFLQFFIRDNKLDMLVCMRSNDVIFGLTYDVFMFSFLQELMAAELGVELGKYMHLSANMHMYMKDEEKIKSILSENCANRETFKFAHIPTNFRDNDLKILLELEEVYWGNIDKDIVLEEYKGDIEKLSPLGKQLLYLLLESD